MTYNDSSCGSPGEGSGVGWVKPQFDHKDNFLYGHYIMTYNDI